MSNLEEIFQNLAAAFDKIWNFAEEFFSDTDNIVWGLVLLAVLFAVAAFVKIRNYFKPVRLFTNNSGIVEVSRSALETLKPWRTTIRRVGRFWEGLGSISPRCSVIFSRTGLNLLCS